MLADQNHAMNSEYPCLVQVSILLVLPQEITVNTHSYIDIKIDVLQNFFKFKKKAAKFNIIRNEDQYKQFV